MKNNTKYIAVYFLITVLMLIPNYVNAKGEQTASTTINGKEINWEYKLNSNNEIEELDCKNVSDLAGSITIPNEIDGKIVKTIADDAFAKCTGITEVTIPSSVKELGARAFENCTVLSKVNLGNIESIKYDVFKGCTALTEITIPKTLKSGSIFSCLNNKNITKINLEEGLTVIPENLCSNTGITEITIPKSVIKIENDAFAKCTGITEVTIPSSVKELGARAFENCTVLSKVNLGNIESIKYDVFKGCTALTEITIPKTLKSGSIFSCLNNKNITKINLEEGLTVIPENLCSNTGITEITIPKSVIKIENDAFAKCKELKKITILDNVINIGSFTDSYETYGDVVFENHNEDLTIYCYENSIAAKYATAKNIKYVYLTKPSTETPQEGENNNKGNENKTPSTPKKQNTKKDETIAPGNMPYTGGTFFIVLAVLAIATVAIYVYKRNNDLKGI